LNIHLLSPPREKIYVRGSSFLSPLILPFSPRREKEFLCEAFYKF
jgi:hypothetical protein